MKKLIKTMSKISLKTATGVVCKHIFRVRIARTLVTVPTVRRRQTNWTPLDHANIPESNVRFALEKHLNAIHVSWLLFELAYK